MTYGDQLRGKPSKKTIPVGTQDTSVTWKENESIESWKMMLILEKGLWDVPY